MVITIAKGVVSLQASWHRGSDVQGNVQGFHQKGELQEKISTSLMSFLQVMNFFIAVADARKEEVAKKKLTELRDSPRTVDMFMKTFSYKQSKFQTMCHADFWTSQIMFSLNEDGNQFVKKNALQLLLIVLGSPKRVKILDYQVLMP